MIGEILRILDDSMIYFLLENYGGYSLSPEAILALLGNAIGTSVINPNPSSNSRSPSPPPANDMFFDDESFNPNQSLMLKNGDPNSVHGSLTANLNYVSLINNYRKFGVRSPNGSLSPPKERGGGGGADEWYQTSSSLDSSTNAFRHGISSTQNEPVRGYTLRHIDYDMPSSRQLSRPPSSTANGNKTTLAGGYRVTPLKEKEHPYFNNHSSPYPSIGENGGKKTPLVILSSEHFKTIANEMNYHYTLDERNELVKEEKKENDLSSQISDAISVMHEQLLEEGILPSLRPEKLLTNQQIEELGLKMKSVDAIFTKITGKDISEVLSRAPTSRAEEIKAKLKRNPTMTSSQLSLINDLLELEREQQKGGGDESKQTTGGGEGGGGGAGDLLSSVTGGGGDSGDNYSIGSPLEAHSPMLSVPVSPAIPPSLPRHSPSLLEKGKTFSTFAISSLIPIPEGIKSTDSHDDYLRLSHSKSKEIEKPMTPATGLQLPSLLPEGSSPPRSPLRKSQTLPSGLFTRDSSNSLGSPTLHFQGTINLTTTDEEKKRIQLASRNESERASERLVLPDARDPLIKYKELLEEFPIIKESIEAQEKAEKERKRKHEEEQQRDKDRKSSRRGNRRSRSKEKKEKQEKQEENPTEIIQKGKLTLLKKPGSPMKEEESFFKEFPNLKDSLPQKGTKAIKTRTDEEKLPNNPYGSWHEETKVMNTGVAAGAGLMLWQPRDRVTSNRRYRVSSQISASPLRPLPQENYNNQPGVSPNIRSYGYNCIHSDNIYSKTTSASGGRVKPFVSAT
jgi:hypothetical protein